MRRRVGIGFSVLALLLVSAGHWGYGLIRRVDGRTPTQWLAYANVASQSIAYRGSGSSLTQGTRVYFTLNQGVDGRYVMTMRDAQGRTTSLGNDGSEIWYTTKQRAERIATSRRPVLPVPKHARILGTATTAGRPVVRVGLSNGYLQKIVAIDRQTGVILALTTRAQGRVQSEMAMDRIVYGLVDVPSCATECRTRATAVDRATLESHLGGKIVEPQWLPKGFVLTDMLLEPCGECGKPMGVLHYSDGLGAISLFLMRQHPMMCRMGEECRRTGTAGSTLIAGKTIGAFVVTAVGSVQAQVLQRILDSMR